MMTKEIDLGGWGSVEAAKAAMKVKHSADCTEDCHAHTDYWHVTESDGRYFVVLCHDTYSGDGFGAWWQTLEDFGTRAKADAFLAALQS